MGLLWGIGGLTYGYGQIVLLGILILLEGIVLSWLAVIMKDNDLGIAMDGVKDALSLSKGLIIVAVSGALSASFSNELMFQL